MTLNDVDMNELKSDVIAGLKAGSCEITFKKNDGSETTRIFTLVTLPDSVSKDAESKRKANPDVCTAFQLVPEIGWRSFRWENLITYTKLS